MAFAKQITNEWGDTKDTYQRLSAILLVAHNFTGQLSFHVFPSAGRAAEYTAAVLAGEAPNPASYIVDAFDVEIPQADFLALMGSAKGQDIKALAYAYSAGLPAFEGAAAA